MVYMSSKMLSHFFLTPFGIGVSDQLWLMYRLELIENIVLPSLASQTLSDFFWMILIDKRMPNVVRIKLDKILNGYSFIRIIELENYSERIQFSRNIGKIASSDFVIQSRIDDDDALNIDAVNQIRQSVLQMLKDGYDCGAVGIGGGYDFLCEDNTLVKNFSCNLAIGMSVFHSAKSSVGIFDIKHDDLLDRYAEKSTCKILGFDGYGYLYAKHSLCDSSYFGMKARIVRNTDKFTEGCDSKFWERFGLAEENINTLNKVFKESPITYPSKANYISMVKDRAKKDGDFFNYKESVNNMSSLLRYRLDKNDISILAIGEISKRIINKSLSNNYISGFCKNMDVTALSKEFLYHWFDLVVIDEVVINELVEVFGYESAILRLKYIQNFTNYFLIVRWNRYSSDSIYRNFSKVGGVIKLLYKAQDIGGWCVLDESLEENKIIDMTINQMLINLI